MADAAELRSRARRWIVIWAIVLLLALLCWAWMAGAFARFDGARFGFGTDAGPGGPAAPAAPAEAPTKPAQPASGPAGTDASKPVPPPGPVGGAPTPK